MVKYLFILFSFSFGAIINVPADYPTIQEAIDAANPSDEVLVDDGTYTENLLIENDLYLHSVNGANATIIDGSNGRGLGSTIVTRPQSMTTHHPLIEINGFGILNGAGTTIEIVFNGEIITQKVGGGLFVYVNSPKINNCQFLGNGNNSTDKGGAVFAASGGDDIGFPDRDHYQDHPDLEPATDPLDFSYNTFQGNRADYGHSVYIDGFENTITSMAGDILDVFSTIYTSTSEYWVKSESEINFSGAYSDVEAIYDSVWVNPDNGINEGNIIGDINNPFLTIDYAMSMIYPTEENPITINLTAGTFSPPIEVFPINMISNISLSGAGEEMTILDAEGTSIHIALVVKIEHSYNIQISNLNITKGYNLPPGSQPSVGGGVNIITSHSVELTNLIVNRNYGYYGVGIFIDNSNVIINNSEVSLNTSPYHCGGMAMHHSNVILNNVIISGNIGSYEHCGGACVVDSDVEFINCVIDGNEAYSAAALSVITNSNISVINTFISNNNIGIMDNIGVIQILGSNAKLQNVLFNENNGGIVLGEGSSIELHHVTMANNNIITPIIMNNDASSTIIKNSIIWDSGLPLIENSEAFFDVSYSDIDYDDFIGDGNISIDPEFVDYESDDYSLQSSSECINAGENEIWNLDLDGSIADMGHEGGAYILPNFTEYDFGEVGPNGSNVTFMIDNYRESPITIDNVEFVSSSFSSETIFPITIESLQTGIISINCVPQAFEIEAGEMILISDDLPHGLSVQLFAIGTDELILSGNIEGFYANNDYRIVDHLHIEYGDTVIIEAGASFLFNGAYDFVVEGVLQAEGTENDSILFTNFIPLEGEDPHPPWRGMTFNYTTEATILDYVIIKGAIKSSGGGILMYRSSLTILNTSILENFAGAGGGIFISESSLPIIEKVNFIDNSSAIYSLSGIIANDLLISGHGDLGSSVSPIYISSVEELDIVINKALIINNHTYTGNIITIDGNANTLLNNITFASNSGMWVVSQGNPSVPGYQNSFINNSIFWNNNVSHGILSNINYTPYNLLQSEHINTNPNFVDPENGDYRLQVNSPCIDAGTSFFEYEGEILVDMSEDEYYGNAPDMGAYEWYPEEPDYQTGDVTQDGDVNVQDIVLLIAFILVNDTADSNEFALADLNTDGLLNVLDVVILVDMILGG